MRLRFSTFGFVVCFGSVALAQSKEVLLDALCAEVNNTLIPWTEVQDKIQNGPLVKYSDYGSGPHPVAHSRALNDAINGRLIQLKADELDIQVSDDQVETQIQQILNEGHFTRDSLKDYLAKQGKTYEQYKKDIRDQMVFMRFRGRVILPLIKISDRDTEAYYLKKQGSSAESAELSLRKILIPIESEQVAAEKEKLALEIYNKLKSGLSFEEAHKLYSKSEDSLQVLKLNDLDLKIRSALQDLKNGDVSAPIRLGAAYHLFYVEDRRLVGSQDFLQKKDALERELHALEVSRQTDFWLQKERSKSNIQIKSECK